MYARILIPLDGSPLAEGILPYARSLEKTLKVPVELLMVIKPEVISEFSNPEAGRYFDTVGARIRRDGVDYLLKVAHSFPDLSNVTCSVEIGKPAEMIVDKASAQQGTLIAMATHGRSGVGRWVLGSVTDRVVRHSGDPVLVVQAGRPCF